MGAVPIEERDGSLTVNAGVATAAGVAAGPGVTHVQVLGDGWAQITWSDRTYTVLVRSVANKGRRVITDLVVRDQRVGPNTLKTLPIAWIEAMLNVRLATGDTFTFLDTMESSSVHIADRDNPVSKRLSTALAEVGRVAELPDSETLSMTFDDTASRSRLTRPDGSNPDAFYRRVAEAYLDTLRRTSTIAPVLAEEAGVPVATVHRWISEARRRGFLPRTRQGRAG